MKFQPSIRIGKKVDAGGFKCGLVVGSMLVRVFHKLLIQRMVPERPNMSRIAL